MWRAQVLLRRAGKGCLTMSTSSVSRRQGGGGRGPYKFSTLSGKEGAEGKLGWTKGTNVVISTTAVIALMGQVMRQLSQLEVARAQDKAQAEAERVQDKAQAEAERNKLEVQDKAQAEAEVHKLEVARVEDKARLYEYFVRIVATKDFESLKAILDENARKKSENGEAGSLSRP